MTPPNPADPLPDPVPPPVPDPSPAPPSRDTGLRKCAFCSCSIGPDGQYVKLSERAIELRDLAQVLEDERKKFAAERAELQRTIAALKQTIDDPAAPRRGYRL